MESERLGSASQLWLISNGTLLPMQRINKILDYRLPLVCYDALGMELNPLHMSILDVKSFADM